MGRVAPEPFSDGKLTTRIHDPRCDFVLAELASHGAPEEILYKSKPHIGTDRLRQVVASLRQEILRLGGEIRFLTCMEELEGDRQGVHSLHVAFQGGREEIPASAVILAVGHSARDSFQMLQRRQLEMEPKAFSVGVRIEQLQSEIDKDFSAPLQDTPPWAGENISYPCGGETGASIPFACVRAVWWCPPALRREEW